MLRQAQHDVLIDSEYFLNNFVIKETTIGNRTLLNSPKYRINYQFDDNVLEHIKELTMIRNTVHLQSDANFKISTKFIESFERLNSFVDATIQRLITS